MKTILLAAIFVMPVSAQVCVDDAKVIAPILSDAARKTHSENLDIALANYTAKPGANSVIWLARRQGYFGQYKEAVRTISTNLSRFQEDARMYRHRGHRYITLRCFDDAIRDFEAAAKLIRGKPDEVEPDGFPNAKNIPTSTLQSNIWYHLGLAYYLKGDFKAALRAYKEAQKVSKNNDMRVATSYWHYMTLRRMGKTKEAAKLLEQFAGDTEVIENTDYLKLIKLNRGEIKPEALLSEIQGDAITLGSASLGYGVGNYFLYNGDRSKASDIFRKIIAGNQWASFGYIAAENDLARMATSQK
jgi:hypothetical protein